MVAVGVRVGVRVRVRVRMHHFFRGILLDGSGLFVFPARMAHTAFVKAFHELFLREAVSWKELIAG